MLHLTLRLLFCGIWWLWLRLFSSFQIIIVTSNRYKLTFYFRDWNAEQNVSNPLDGCQDTCVKPPPKSSMGFCFRCCGSGMRLSAGQRAIQVETKIWAWASISQSAIPRKKWEGTTPYWSKILHSSWSPRSQQEDHDMEPIPIIQLQDYHRIHADTSVSRNGERQYDAEVCFDRLVKFPLRV